MTKKKAGMRIEDSVGNIPINGTITLEEWHRRNDLERVVHFVAAVERA